MKKNCGLFFRVVSNMTNVKEQIVLVQEVFWRLLSTLWV